MHQIRGTTPQNHSKRFQRLDAPGTAGTAGRRTTTLNTPQNGYENLSNHFLDVPEFDFLSCLFHALYNASFEIICFVSELKLVVPHSTRGS